MSYYMTYTHQNKGKGMLSESAIELMNLVRLEATTLHKDGQLSTQDYHLMMNVAESILREHDGE